MKLSLKEIVEITDGVLISGNPEDEVLDLCIDSRMAKKGDLFIPLLGANTDGHHYLLSALKEASAALCSQEGILVSEEKGLILVKDTEKAMDAIGVYRMNLRNRLKKEPDKN